MPRSVVIDGHSLWCPTTTRRAPWAALSPLHSFRYPSTKCQPECSFWPKQEHLFPMMAPFRPLALPARPSAQCSVSAVIYSQNRIDSTLSKRALPEPAQPALESMESILSKAFNGKRTPSRRPPDLTVLRPRTKIDSTYSVALRMQAH